MADYLESSDYSYCFSYTGSAPHSFTFNKYVKQFVLVGDVDALVTWTNNIGSYSFLAGESLALPIKVHTITISPTISGTFRVIGIG